MTPQDYGRAGGVASGQARLADALDGIHAEIPGLSPVQAKLVLRLVLREKERAYFKGYKARERYRARTA